MKYTKFTSDQRPIRVIGGDIEHYRRASDGVEIRGSPIDYDNT